MNRNIVRFLFLGFIVFDMALIQTEENCDLCGEELVINCDLEAREGYGVCNECGLPHSFSPDNPVEFDGIESVETCYGPDVVDWMVIESYYEATGNRAYTVTYCESMEEQREEFYEWANDRYNMHWGKSLDEIDEL